MQKSETAKILKFLRDAYPVHYKGQKEDEYSMLVDLWTYQFRENDLNAVFQALNAAIASKTDGFPPSIGEVKARLVDITNPNVSSFDATWDRFLACFKRGSVHAAEDWEKLPPDDRELISPGEIYRISITEDCNLTVEKAGYYSRWKAQQEKRRIEKAVPLPVREAMETAKKKALEQIRDTEPLAIPEDSSKSAEIRVDWSKLKKNEDPLNGVSMMDYLKGRREEE